MRMGEMVSIPNRGDHEIQYLRSICPRERHGRIGVHIIYNIVYNRLTSENETPPNKWRSNKWRLRFERITVEGRVAVAARGVTAEAVSAAVWAPRAGGVRAVVCVR
eukprot:COSAG02_NODE_238_length_27685_cov_11.570792_10_plen_106_part_00